MTISHKWILLLLPKEVNLNTIPLKYSGNKKNTDNEVIINNKNDDKYNFMVFIKLLLKTE